METVRFLRDIEDETKYAQGLEMAYIDAFEAMTDVERRLLRDKHEGTFNTMSDDIDLVWRCSKELRHVLFTMSVVICDCAARRKRLADVAAGLTDVVFDKETP